MNNISVCHISKQIIEPQPKIFVNYICSAFSLCYMTVQMSLFCVRSERSVPPIGTSVEEFIEFACV